MNDYYYVIKSPNPPNKSLLNNSRKRILFKKLSKLNLIKWKWQYNANRRLQKFIGNLHG